MKIGNIEIGKNYPPLVIPEMSGNHHGDIEVARQIVKAAAASGAKIIKLQTYTADTLTLNCDKPDFVISNPDSLWPDRKLYDLYEEAHTPWEWHEELFKLANDLGMLCFSSPFDETAVDFLEKLNVPAYKIASFECVHLPLIRKAAKTGKPLIVSTGLATEQEVGEALEAARSAGAKDIVILKCTSDYPARPQDVNLATMLDMQKKFGVEVGFSDHTLGVDVSVQAVKYYGAVVIEKHLALPKEASVDSEFSLKPDEFKELIDKTANIKRADWHENINSPAHGVVQYGGTEKEQPSRIFRQSIQVSRPVKKGEIFTPENLIIRRPGYGLAPKYYESLLGKKAARDLDFGDRTSADMISEKLT